MVVSAEKGVAGMVVCSKLTWLSFEAQGVWDFFIPGIYRDPVVQANRLVAWN